MRNRLWAREPVHTDYPDILLLSSFFLFCIGVKMSLTGMEEEDLAKFGVKSLSADNYFWWANDMEVVL